MHEREAIKGGVGHGEADLGRVDARGFEVRIARDGHFDAIKAPALRGGLERGDVAQVRRVERPSKETEAMNFHRAILRDPPASP